MEKEKHFMYFLFLLVVLACPAACSSKPNPCPVATGTPRYLTLPPNQLPTPAPASGPVEVEIGGKTIQVDKVVSGPLCNDSWSGTVYVTCDVQIYPWQEKPTFMKNCNLNIAPGTVVYVAYHNDTAYYQGCSCHTGETATP
jgi:hypothetical protein